MFNLLKHEMNSRWGAVIGWGIGLFLFAGMYIGIYPEMAESIKSIADLSIYKAMGFFVDTFESYLGSTVVLFTPIILGIYAIGASTHTLGGEEDDGTLELVLAMPLHRWQIVTVKAIAIGAATFFILVIGGLGNGIVVNAIKAFTDVEVVVTFQQVFIATLNGWPFIMAFVMMGMFLGAYLPNRRTSTMTLTVVFVASYFGENLAGYVNSLDWLKPFSLFTYFDSTSTVFNEGVQSSDVLDLLGIAAVFFILALLSFERRNVTVGAWPWQRAQAKMN